jgi:AraC-like DNA-binding protein
VFGDCFRRKLKVRGLDAKELKEKIQCNRIELKDSFFQRDLYIETFLCVWNTNLKDLADLNREKIAQRMGISKSHLSNRIRESYNMSLFEILEFIRILKAAELLKERLDLTIREIAELIGIRKGDHFRKKFKKYFGMVPSEYRRFN